ncbi:uncharacterized protein LOC113280009 [Papaver somniferum]|uniref:uncharacterized protein LOC113280009 n=1 Tax=Papaver somniferum TaxID=3469 RepID=UPI000E702BDE|nr:uncharacterized protein LOC113280009 [Papaver somniferum]
MRSMLKDLGMKAKAIHACENHCILYYEENEDSVECPVCKTMRFKLKSTKDDRAQVSSEYMRHPINSSQWAQMKMKFPLFAAEGRNVWLGISTYGFNPHGVQTLSWSCLPVILVVYNIPPSMCMKSEFQMMTLLIPGRVFYSESNSDVGIHDLPAQGVLSGCTTHGYCACVCCTDETRSTHLGYGIKIVYTNYRIFLKKSAPLGLIGAQSLEKFADVHYEPGKLVVRDTGKQKRYQYDEEEGDSELVTGAFFKKCILWELESYFALTIWHCVDVMHTEKNVMEHIIYTIFDKDNKAIVAWNNRDKLKENKLNCGEWKEKKTKKGVEMVLLFVLSKKEKTDFCQILKDLKFPTGFSSNISKNVNMEQLNLSILKSHDYHVIMGYLLPVLLQHAFPGEKDLHTALQQVSLYFRILCLKVVSREYLNQAKWMIAEAMYVLEKYFPAGFFDISVHNMVHLADEALVCGPVRYRWMYPFERAMKECKNIPNNNRYIEGSITKSTEMDECVIFDMEHMKNADQ